MKAYQKDCSTVLITCVKNSNREFTIPHFYFYLLLKKNIQHFLLRFSSYLGSNKPLQDINFENHPELWTPKKRNVYRSRALGKWKELTQADCRNLEQEMKNILTKLRKYVDWVDDIVNGTHNPGNQFLMHLRFDPKLRRSTSHNQYSSTFEGFLLFSRNLIEHKVLFKTTAYQFTESGYIDKVVILYAKTAYNRTVPL